MNATNAPKTAVLVTGTSTGIGRATALRLAKRGTIVYAGVRKESDAQKIASDGGANIRPLMLDVLDATSIARAIETIAARTDVKLGALVNNAGAAYAGPLEIMPLGSLREQFELNFFAPLALVQATLPLLRETRGRIINISSIGGKITTPFVGAYSASKYALEAASDALRVEVAPFGIKIVLIEPGAVKTPIWDGASARSYAMVEGIPPAMVALYEKQIGALTKIAAQQSRDGSEPELVAAAIEHALDARKPKARYLVGSDARFLRVISRLPDGVRDTVFRTLFARNAAPIPAPPSSVATTATT